MQSLSFKMFVTFAIYIHIILHSAPHNTYYVLFIFYNKVLWCIFKKNMKTNRNITNSCYYWEVPNVLKKNLIIIKSIIVSKWNHLFKNNYFRKKKKEIIIMDLSLETFRSFVVQWSTKIVSCQPQLKPLRRIHFY